ncbi:helix-turn-helix domain-containing protein [Cronobacter malonaticus]
MTIPHMTIGERIRTRRKDLGLTQKSLAKALKISDVSVSQWERDTSEPTGKNLHALCKVLRCTAAWILFGDETKAPEEPGTQLIQLDEREQELLNLFNAITDTEQTQFLNELRARVINNQKLLEELLKAKKRSQKK